MKESIVQAINKQLNLEFYSAYLYLSFANYCQEQGLGGFANWYNVQAQEERDHAMMLVKYLHDNEEKVVYEAIAKPAGQWNSWLDVLKSGLAHERAVTAGIYKIYEAAEAEKDYRTMQFLNWFIQEQGEEEAAAAELVQRGELFGGDIQTLYLLDKELKTRNYAPTGRH